MSYLSTLASLEDRRMKAEWCEKFLSNKGLLQQGEVK